MSDSSVFTKLIDEPKKDRPLEPEIVRKGPQPIIPPARYKSSPTEKLLDWVINRWPGATVTTRNICQFGPRSSRGRERAISLAQTLVEHGWLIPIKKHRYDMQEWQIVRSKNQQINTNFHFS
jgi:hypothetical protein